MRDTFSYVKCWYVDWTVKLKKKNTRCLLLKFCSDRQLLTGFEWLSVNLLLLLLMIITLKQGVLSPHHLPLVSTGLEQKRLMIQEENGCHLWDTRMGNLKWRTLIWKVQCNRREISLVGFLERGLGSFGPIPVLMASWPLHATFKS